jgi:hypothetical protein
MLPQSLLPHVQLPAHTLTGWNPGNKQLGIPLSFCQPILAALAHNVLGSTPM